MLKNKIFSTLVVPEFGTTPTSCLNVRFKHPEEKTISDRIDLETCSVSELRIIKSLVENTLDLTKFTLDRRQKGLYSIKVKQKNEVLTKDDITSALTYQIQIDTLLKKIIYLNHYLELIENGKKKRGETHSSANIGNGVKFCQ
jgi:uncharacterized ubiquitin-like protein YukD